VEGGNKEKEGVRRGEKEEGRKKRRVRSKQEGVSAEEKREPKIHQKKKRTTQKED